MPCSPAQIHFLRDDVCRAKLTPDYGPVLTLFATEPSAKYIKWVCLGFHPRGFSYSKTR